jgi:hypothetical protein
VIRWVWILGLVVACSSPQGAPPSEPPLSATPIASSPSSTLPPPPVPALEAAPSATAWSTPPPGPKPSANYAEARRAALTDNWMRVRELLGPIVMSGRAAPEEMRLVKEACKQMHDRACVDEIKRQYPKPPPE